MEVEMAVQLAAAPRKSILFEDYESEGEISVRYEIIDGVRVYMPATTLGHQRYSARLNDEFQSFSSLSKLTVAFYAPCDVVINRFPLQVRQPDLLVVSQKKYTDSGLTFDSVYFNVAPELVVEIISSSETFNALASKIRDYQKIRSH